VSEGKGRKALVFITSSLASGRDGVGDYTRVLARECSLRGHSAGMISLSERDMRGEIDRGEEIGEYGCIPVLRLGTEAPWDRKVNRAKDFLRQLRPRVVSLQFVPYGFQKRGIISTAGPKLAEICGGYESHIMFHELWSGVSLRPGIKHYLLGKVQKGYILKLARALSLRMTHTNLVAHRELLNKSGIRCRKLPLFGNVPVTRESGEKWLYPLLEKEGMDIGSYGREKMWLFGMFGAIPRVWPAEPLFSLLAEAAGKRGKKAAVISAGDLRGADAEWERIRKGAPSGMVFLKLGYMESDKMSQFLNTIDFGISTTPRALIGKSGSTAAMLEHGLPVIVNRDDIKLPPRLSGEDVPEPLLHEMGPDIGEKIVTWKRGERRGRAGNVAEQFIKDVLGGEDR